jgi:hypothetical protein
MALAVEDGDTAALSAAAGNLGLTAHQVNAAVLQSLAFAANMNF